MGTKPNLKERDPRSFTQYKSNFTSARIQAQKPAPKDLSAGGAFAGSTNMKIHADQVSSRIGEWRAPQILECSRHSLVIIEPNIGYSRLGNRSANSESQLDILATIE